MSIRGDQIDIVASELEAAGTNSRQLSIKAGGVSEDKLGFSWKTVEIPASAFSFSATRSTYTLTTAASSSANVLDNSELLRNGLGGADRVATTTVTGDWSLSGTTLSVHGDVTATGDSYTIRYVIGTGSGASASGNMIWLGTVPQDPLQAESDYFNGNALDPKWEEWDVLGEVTVTQSGGEVTLSKTAATGGYGGIIQDMPADDQFCITARFAVSGLYGVNNVAATLIIGEDLSTGTGSPSTNGFFTSQVHNKLGVAFNSDVYNTYNSWASITNGNQPAPSGNIFYLRWFVDRTAGVAGEVTPLISADGKTWVRYAAIDVNAQAAVTALVSMGITIFNITGGEASVICDVFRVDLTADPELAIGGQVGFSSGGGASAVDTRHIWYPPETSNVEDDEFDSPTLDAAWVVYDGVAGVAGTISTADVDVYDTAFNSGSVIRVNADPVERRSWALFQPPGKASPAFGSGFVLNKPYTLPTNVLIWARLKFSIRIALTQDDHSVGLVLGATSGGIWDEANTAMILMNETDPTQINAQAIKVVATVVTTIGNTTNVASGGQAYEYVAIHKLGANYHFWVGTAAGNWCWMGTTTLAFTPDRVGIYVSNTNAAAPGPMILGCDFIRFSETDKFKL